MRILSYLMLALALALTATLLAGLVWAATHIDWTHKVFSEAFWTETPEDVRNAVLVFRPGRQTSRLESPHRGTSQIAS